MSSAPATAASSGSCARSSTRWLPSACPMSDRAAAYIWCRLPDGVDSKRFINRAYNMGLILIPGYVFYPFKNGGRNYVRINYSYESDERLLAGMEVFRAALLESLEG